ncbi:MAG: ribonuclease HII [Thermoplasmata archaeon]|nr:ribonuclease HII [Thermoplasmata archaeon]
MICGIDEAGRGPVLGPLVICGITVQKDDLLRKFGVKDSKRLTRPRRIDLSKKIERVADDIEVVEISAMEIDALRDEMTLNALEAKVFASIIQKLEPEIAYVDAADIDENRFATTIMTELESPVNLIARHKADETYPVVSAASIIAKVRRDERISEIEEAIGEPIGSGYTSDPNTIRFIESWVQRTGALPPHSRKSWDTCSRLLRLRSIATIDQFQEGK